MGFEVQSRLDSRTQRQPHACSLSIGVHCASRKGEDLHDVRAIRVGGVSLTVAAVYDGHSGRAAAQLCCDCMAPRIEAYANETFEASMSREDTFEFEHGFGLLRHIGRCICNAFKQLHQQIREGDPKVGTTATVLVVDTANSQLLCANVGDSEVMVVDSSHWAMVSTNHRLSANKSEVDRVRRADGAGLAMAVSNDGKRTPMGGLRLWPGGLALGRSLGDADCGVAVIAEPALEMVDVDGEATVVVASDGVWGALDHEQVVLAARADRSADAIARSIVASAVDKAGLRDDTTCMVLQLARREEPDATPSSLSDIFLTQPPKPRLSWSTAVDQISRISARLARLVPSRSLSPRIRSFSSVEALPADGESAGTLRQAMLGRSGAPTPP